MVGKRISIQHLKREAKFLKDSCLWSNSHYWTTQQLKAKRVKSKVTIKIVYLNFTGWLAFVFNKFHQEAVSIFRSLPKESVWFYQEPINQFMNFSVWCIDVQLFESVLSQLQMLSNVEVEFVVPQTKKELCIPALFKEMGLKFFEVNQQ